MHGMGAGNEVAERIFLEAEMVKIGVVPLTEKRNYWATRRHTAKERQLFTLQGAK
jgi:hypothetical protein